MRFCLLFRSAYFFRFFPEAIYLFNYILNYHLMFGIPGVLVPEDEGGAADPAVVGEDRPGRRNIPCTIVVAVNFIARELENKPALVHWKTDIRHPSSNRTIVLHQIRPFMFLYCSWFLKKSIL